LLIYAEFVLLKNSMHTEIGKRLGSLPKTEASFLEPMDCLSVSKLPAGLGWIWEIKLDGYRALAVKSGSGLTLLSRRRKSLNRQFPNIVEALADLPAGTVVLIRSLGRGRAVRDNHVPDRAAGVKEVFVDRGRYQMAVQQRTDVEAKRPGGTAHPDVFSRTVLNHAIEADSRCEAGRPDSRFGPLDRTFACDLNQCTTSTCTEIPSGMIVTVS
jgi:hypothetical protein